VPARPGWYQRGSLNGRHIPRCRLLRDGRHPSHGNKDLSTRPQYDH
jgi:hypothetical protein